MHVPFVINVENLPFAHGVQKADPFLTVPRPNWQKVHAILLVLKVYCPFEQYGQLCAAKVGLKVPGEQGRQAASPVSD